MNQIILSGVLTEDPKMKTKDGSKTILIAYVMIKNAGWKKDGKREYSILDCVAFDEQAEFVMKKLKKDMRILIKGRIHAGSYIGKDGSKVYTKDIIIDDVEIFYNDTEARGKSREGE